jgi:Rieske Fe-S protein
MDAVHAPGYRVTRCSAISCNVPAHGSEFDSQGGIRNGPAEAKLRTFPVTVANDLLKISLKAVS